MVYVIRFNVYVGFLVFKRPVLPPIEICNINKIDDENSLDY